MQFWLHLPFRKLKQLFYAFLASSNCVAMSAIATVWQQSTSVPVLVQAQCPSVVGISWEIHITYLSD